MLLSEVLPEYDFRERHSRRVGAPRERVFAAVRSMTVVDSTVGHVLFGLRGLSADPGRPVLEQMGRFGFEVAAESEDELVVAAIGRPWRLRGDVRPTRGDFRSFAEPGYAKMAMNFRLEDGVLTTETRIRLTDARSKRAFRRYWLVVRPFSGLIRREWLRVIARRASASERQRE